MAVPELRLVSGLSGPHDLGAAPALRGAAVEPLTKDHALMEWELDIDALQNVFEGRPTDAASGSWPGGVHAFRRRIEALDDRSYASLSYYGRWAVALAQLCLENGLISQRDLDAQFGPSETEAAAAFAVGDAVRVRPYDTATRWRRPHLRTPGYIFNKPGVIVSCEGAQENPEVSTYGRSGAKQPLYRVAFRSRDLWASLPCDPSASGQDDEVIVEVFQHWLEPLRHAGPEEPVAKRLRMDAEQARGHGHDDEGHSHTHGEHGHDHPHDARENVEQAAVEKEGLPCPGMQLAECLVRVLLDKGVVKTTELREMRDLRDSYSRSDLGARVVAHAWQDESFRQRLLEDANAALLAEFGECVGAKLVVVANSPSLHNVVVCTLCSCYPTRILGRPPSWYKSSAYRARCVVEPRAVLREFGTELPPSVRIAVHDSTADLRYLVLPEKPPRVGADEDLASLVTRDHMVGVRR